MSGRGVVFRFLDVSDSFLSVMDIFCGVQMPVCYRDSVGRAGETDW
jgi:hypothetical protein